jgi:hypothetical protein
MYLNCKFARVNYDNVGQSAVLRFVRRYKLVYRRILSRQSVSTIIFLSSFWHHKFIRYARLTYHFIWHYCTPDDVKLMHTRQYTTCARRLEYLTLSDIDRLVFWSYWAIFLWRELDYSGGEKFGIGYCIVLYYSYCNYDGIRSACV